jgi:hypothetical protein
MTNRATARRGNEPAVTLRPDGEQGYPEKYGYGHGVREIVEMAELPALV